MAPTLEGLSEEERECLQSSWCKMQDALNKHYGSLSTSLSESWAWLFAAI